MLTDQTPIEHVCEKKHDMRRCTCLHFIFHIDASPFGKSTDDSDTWPQNDVCEMCVVNDGDSVSKAISNDFIGFDLVHDVTILGLPTSVSPLIHDL